MEKKITKGATSKVPGTKARAGGIKAKDLAPIFALCRPYVSRTPLVPVMQHFCVRGGRIMATDGKVGIVARLPVALPETTLPANLLTDLVASFPDDQAISLSLGEGGALQIAAASYRGTVKTYSVADFPWAELPAKRTPLDPGTFETLNKVAFCRAGDENRMALAAVSFDATVKGEGRATDSVRLAWRRAKTGDAFAGLVPGILAERVLGRVAPTEYAVDLQGRLWLFFADPAHAVFSVPLAVEYPDTRGIIDGAAAKAKVAPGFTAGAGFADAIRRMLFLAERESAVPLVTMALAGSTLTLSISGAAEGCVGEAAERVPVTPIRPAKRPVVMGINGAFLLDAAERCEEFFLLDTMLVGFAEKRAFGCLVMRMQA